MNNADNIEDLQQLRTQLEAEKHSLYSQSAKLNAQILEHELSSELAKRQLPAECLPFILNPDREIAFSKLNSFENIYRSSVQNAVAQELLKMVGTDVPRETSNNNLTKEKVASMSAEEINQNWDAISDFLQNT